MAGEPELVVVGLGSNLDDPAQQIVGAVRYLDAVADVDVRAVSSLYRTAPIGPPQPDFLNAAALLATTLLPRTLLAECLAAESAGGRVRAERWGPRTIDIDILWWGARSVAEPSLVVPHPRLVERRFALEPLLELVPDARLPDGRPLADVLAALPDQGVRRLPDSRPTTI